MANQNYDQVTDLITQGKLHWATDSINALLVTGSTFNASDKTLGDLNGVSIRATQPIQGREVSPDNYGLGQPVAFPKASEGVEYQVIVVQDLGNNTTNLLAFIDDDQDGEPLTVSRSGTFILRPVLRDVPEDPEDDEPTPTIGVWIRLGA